MSPNLAKPEPDPAQVTVTAIYDLALTLSEQGKPAEAKARYDDALTRLEEAAVRQKYGDAPAALQSVRASVLLHASQVELQLGQLAAAEAQLREALSLSEARWGADLVWEIKAGVAGQHGPSG